MGLITRPSTTFAAETWILKDQPTPISTGLLVKSCHPSLLPSDLMVPSTSTRLNSKPTWCPTPESISPWSPMPPSFHLRKPTMNNFPLLRSPMPVSNPPTKWSNVIPVMASIWHAASCTEAMLSPRMSTLPLQPSRPNAPSNSSTGVPLASKLVSTTNPLPLYPAVISLRSNVPFVCCLTPLLSLRLGLVLTISLILCTPSVLLFIGMLEKVWKRVSSLKLVKTWPLLKRITKKSVLTPWKPKVMKEMNTNQEKEKRISLTNTKPARFHQLAILDNSINIFLYMIILIIICAFLKNFSIINLAYLHTNLAP